MSFVVRCKKNELKLGRGGKMINSKYNKFLLTIALIDFLIISISWFIIENRKLNIETKKQWGYGFESRFVEKPYKIIKLDIVTSPLVRFNEQTGEADYWSLDGGGWVKIVDTVLQTTIPPNEIKNRKEILDEWYGMLTSKITKVLDKDSFFSFYERSPSSQIKLYFDTYKENPEKWEEDLFKALSKNKDKD